MLSSYSPISVAEHALTLMLCANRNIVQASKRIANQNFINLLKRFDCNILGYDIYPNHEAAKNLNFLNIQH